MPKITIQNLQINYLDEGQGPALLILHGWGSSLKSYERLVPLLSKHFRVILPELPGFGESEEPREPWNISRYLDFVKDFLEARCIAPQKDTAKPISIYAHSFGARIAIKWLAEGDKRVEKLIMCGAAGIKDEPTKRQKLAKDLSKLGKMVPDFLREPAKKVLYKLAGSHDYRKASKIMKETLRKVVNEDLTPYLEKITIPTLLIWGKNDTYTPLRHGEIMHKKVENSKLVVFSGSRHGVHLQEPEKLAEEVLKFLSQQ